MDFALRTQTRRNSFSINGVRAPDLDRAMSEKLMGLCADLESAEEWLRYSAKLIARLIEAAMTLPCVSPSNT